MKLLLSSSNKDKVRELQNILGSSYELLTKADFNLEHFDVVEDGKTLKENAYIKAKSLYDRTKTNVVADDTGLFVEALDGQPGVYSARYAGENANYQDNNKKLLKELSDLTELKDRKAYFKTVICFISEEGEEIYLDGILNGYIGFEEKGDYGFGYDPLFILDSGETLAELPDEVKNSMSHRSIALEKLKNLLDSRR